MRGAFGKALGESDVHAVEKSADDARIHHGSDGAEAWGVVTAEMTAMDANCAWQLSAHLDADVAIEPEGELRKSVGAAICQETANGVA